MKQDRSGLLWLLVPAVATHVLVAGGAGTQPTERPSLAALESRIAAAESQADAVQAALQSIDSGDVVDGSLTGADFQDGSLQGVDLAPDTIGIATLANLSVGSAQIVDGSVETVDLQPVDLFRSTACRWTDWTNGFEQNTNPGLGCQSTEFLAGLTSEFDPGANDRRFQFRCCQVMPL